MLDVLTQMPFRPWACVPTLQEYDAYQVGQGQGQGVSEAHIFGAGAFVETSLLKVGRGRRATALATAPAPWATLVAALRCPAVMRAERGVTDGGRNSSYRRQEQQPR